jgi:hypothetical protein
VAGEGIHQLVLTEGGCVHAHILVHRADQDLSVRGVGGLLKRYHSGVTVVSQRVLQWCQCGVTAVLQWCYLAVGGVVGDGCNRMSLCLPSP